MHPAATRKKQNGVLPDEPPPHSLEAEQAVIGAALISKSAAARVVEVIGAKRQVFYHEAHRKMYDAIGDLLARPEEKGGPVAIDILTLPEELRNRDQLDQVGGLSYISTLSESVPTAAHVEHYLRTVIEKWVLRECRLLGPEIDRMIQEQPGDVLLIGERAELKLRNALAPLRRNGKFNEGFTSAELAVMDLAPMKWIVPGLISEGLTIISGRGKMGKSWLVFELAVAVALGGVALGKIPVQPGRVLYLALEDSKARLKGRQERIYDGAAPAENLHLFRKWKRMNQGGQQDLIDWFKQYPDTRLVIIDTFAKVRSTGDARANAYDEDYRAMGEIKAVADAHGAGIIVVHHFNKMRMTPTDDWVDQVSGSIGISAAADGIIGFFRDRNKPQAILKITGRDIDDENDKALSWTEHGGPWCLEENAEDFLRTQEEREVLDCIRHTGRPMKANELAVALGLNLSTLKARIYRMTMRSLLANNEGWFSPAEGSRASAPGPDPDDPFTGAVAPVAPTGPIPDPLVFEDNSPEAERETRQRVFNLAWTRGWPTVALEEPWGTIQATEADWRRACSGWFLGVVEGLLARLETTG